MKLFPRLRNKKPFPRIQGGKLAPRFSSKPTLKKTRISERNLRIKAQEVGEIAREWAEAFCLPEERQGLPEEQLTPEERECMRKAGSAFQREVTEALGIS